MKTGSGTLPEKPKIDTETARNIELLNTMIRGYNKKAGGSRPFATTDEMLRKIAERCRDAAITDDLAF